MISADEFSSGPDYATRVKCLLLWCSPPLSYSPFSLLLLFFYPQVICRHNIISPCCLRTRGNFLRVRSSLTMKHQFLSYKTSEGKGYKPLSHIKNILKRSGFVLFLVLLRPLVPPSQCCTAKHCLNPQNKTCGIFPSGVMLLALKTLRDVSAFTISSAVASVRCCKWGNQHIMNLKLAGQLKRIAARKQVRGSLQ